jgi:hypothetical protein
VYGQLGKRARCLSRPNLSFSFRRPQPQPAKRTPPKKAKAALKQPANAPRTQPPEQPWRDPGAASQQQALQKASSSCAPLNERQSAEREKAAAPHSSSKPSLREQAILFQPRSFRRTNERTLLQKHQAPPDQQQGPAAEGGKPSSCRSQLLSFQNQRPARRRRALSPPATRPGEPTTAPPSHPTSPPHHLPIFKHGGYNRYIRSPCFRPLSRLWKPTLISRFGRKTH